MPAWEDSRNCRIDRERFAVDDIQRIADVLIAIDVAILLSQRILDALRNRPKRIDKIVSLRIGLHIQLLPGTQQGVAQGPGCQSIDGRIVEVSKAR